MKHQSLPSGAPSGLVWRPGFLDVWAQQEMLAFVRSVVARAPLFVPRMPGSGRPFSVRMTNCGPLGWVSDKEGGYRYQGHHPETGAPWPELPPALIDLWFEVGGHKAPPEACLINYYAAGAKMGLHRDADEQDMTAPVVSLSLGDAALFRIGGPRRRDRTVSLRLSSGDVLVLGGAARQAYHGIDRIYPQSSDLVAGGGRFNLTLRRVNLP